MGSAAVTGARQMLVAVRAWRAVQWQPMVASWALAAALLGWRIGDVTDTEAAITLLRGVAVLLTLGALFVLDDEALSQVAAAPVSLAVRTTVRAGVAVAGVAVAWLPALALTQAWTGIRIPAAIWLELAAMVASGLAAAAASQRFFDLPAPSVSAGPVTIGLLLGLLGLPQRWAFIVAPGAGWAGAHRRWAVLLAVAVFVLLASMRDPANRSPRARTATTI